MRELKFRAWINWNGNFRSMEYFKFGAVICEKEFSEEEPVMQYTGLKDKNGKEIYEGDIVRGRRWDDKVVTNPVLYFDGSWWAGWIDHSNKNKCLDLLSRMTEVEVIGNIYENPDLLEKK